MVGGWLVPGSRGSACLGARVEEGSPQTRTFVQQPVGAGCERVPACARAPQCAAHACRRPHALLACEGGHAGSAAVHAPVCTLVICLVKGAVLDDVM